MPWDEDFEIVDKKQIVDMRRAEEDQEAQNRELEQRLLEMKKQRDEEEQRRRAEQEAQNQDWDVLEAEEVKVEPVPAGMYRHNDKVKDVKKIGSLKGIRELILKLMPGALTKKLKIEAGLEPALTTLHHSRGTRMYEDGKDVLEFDMAGSGFKQFSQAQDFGIDKKNFYGKTADGKTHKIRIEHMTAEQDVTPRWYNKTRWLSWIPGVRSMKRIKEINEFRKLHPEFRSGEGGYAEKYGERRKISELLGNKECIYVKSKKAVQKDGIEVEKRRITMAGPLGAGGLSNSGEYSIEKLREYMLLMGKEYLEPKLKQLSLLKNTVEALHNEGREDEERQIRERIRPVYLIMKGHSRGAVALSHGAMMIKYWLLKNYPDMVDYVKFETIQYDPVPGTGNDYNVKKEVNLNEKDSKKLLELEKRKMAPLGDEAETTVLYSLLSNYALFFTPQSVKGTKRLILTMHKHAQGLRDVDETQGERHHVAYTYAENGEVYRSSGLNELPEGVYIMDEKRTLVRLENKAQALKMLEEAYKDTYKLTNMSGKVQWDRKSRIREMVETWFDSHQ